MPAHLLLRIRESSCAHKGCEGRNTNPMSTVLTLLFSVIESSRNPPGGGDGEEEVSVLDEGAVESSRCTKTHQIFGRGWDDGTEFLESFSSKGGLGAFKRINESPKKLDAHSSKRRAELRNNGDANRVRIEDESTGEGSRTHDVIGPCSLRRGELDGASPEDRIG